MISDYINNFQLIKTTAILGEIKFGLIKKMKKNLCILQFCFSKEEDIDKHLDEMIVITLHEFRKLDQNEIKRERYKIQLSVNIKTLFPLHQLTTTCVKYNNCTYVVYFSLR